jgi:S-adenosylmethionine-dependent methyltransferase
VRDEAVAEQGDAVEFVQRFYDLGPQQEWERAERHRTEFAVTLRALAAHLPPPPARVLDCGGGPGRYAIELARQGYDVTLFDLSVECLRLAEEKAEEAGVTLVAYEHGTATDLSRFPDESFDALLLMGPLYHLLEEAERVQALREARRALKPGGVLFVAFITRQAALRSAAILEPYWPLEEPDLLELIIGAGQLPPRGATGSGFVAYFAHPREVVPLCRGQGFEVRTVLGVEGLVSMVEEQVNALDGAAWEAWVDLNWRVAPDPALHGGVEHLLVVAHRPRWRAVLRQRCTGFRSPCATWTSRPTPREPTASRRCSRSRWWSRWPCGRENPFELSLRARHIAPISGGSILRVSQSR